MDGHESSSGNVKMAGEDRESMLIIITPVEAPVVPRLSPGLLLKILTAFQKGRPSRSHSFTRLSSSVRVLFMPPVPPGPPGPEAPVLQKNRPNCCRGCHSRRISRHRGGRGKMTGGVLEPDEENTRTKFPRKQRD